MILIRRLLGGLRSLFAKTRTERELDEELRAYLETAVDEKIAAGMTREEAVRAARAEIGSLEAVKDHTRDVGWETLVESLWQDVCYALRMLRRSPGYAAVIILTLGLGVGATTAVFSAVDTVVLRPLPFDEPDRLVAVGAYLDPQPMTNVRSVAPQDFRDWRERQQVFSGLAAIAFASLTLDRPDGAPEALRVLRVSAEFFDVLRVQPMLGRAFSRANESDGAHMVTVLSYGMWRGRFGAAPDIIGRTIPLDGGRYEVVGVMPRDFSYPVAAVEPTDLWVPLVIPPDEQIRQPGRFSSYLRGIGRLRDGVSIDAARAGMHQIALALEAAHPEWNKDRRVAVLPMYDSVVGARTRAWMLLLLGAAITMMLIVCANVASLSLARASARGHEMGTRAAIGAGRWRLARQLLVESFVQCAIGSAVGVALAWWAVQAFRTTLPQEIPRLAALAVDPRVLIVASTAAAVTAMLCGLLPALQASRPHLTGVLRHGQPGATPARVRHRFRSTLLVVETALAVILLVGAGLFIGSFQKVTGVDLGFDPEHILTTTVSVRPDASAAAGAVPALLQLVDRIREIPSVQYAAAISGTAPLATSVSSTTLTTPGRTGERSQVLFSAVTADYHHAMRIPLRRGRYLDDSDDASTTQVILVNETAAKTFFQDQDPIGQTLSIMGERRVVGVVGDVRLDGFESGVGAMAYLPLAQRPPAPPQVTARASSTIWSGSLVIRTAGEPLAVLPAVRAAARSVLPDRPLRDTATFEGVLGRLVAQRRVSMQLLTLFAALGLTIAAIGVYGLTSYNVTQRRHEIGVRMALGSTRAQVIGGLLRTATALSAAGLAIGLAGAWVLGSTVRAFLFQIEPTDLRVFATAVLVLATSALVASVLPAYRAATVDPLAALRQE